MAFTARYATTCGVCGGPISPGMPIESLPGGGLSRWAHAECLPSLFDADAGPLAGRRVTAGTSGPAAAAPAADAGSHLAPGPAAALEVWTDGACAGNPGPGGWAWATRDGRQASGGAPRTTNQRMEIQAALEAVTALPGRLEVVSDSSYVVNCFRDGWWRGWLARGWVNAAKKPVANRDLWEPLVEAVNGRGDVTFRWVKGHSGDPMNDLVDRLAVQAAAAQAAGSRPG